MCKKIARLASPSLLAPIGLVLFSAACWASTPEPPRVSTLLSSVPRATAEEELIVNGEVIPAIVLKRELVYRKGAALLESRKLDILINEEIKAQLEAGMPKDTFELSEEELEQKRAEGLEQIKAQYPELAVEDVLAVNNMTLDLFGDQIRQTQLFDRVFLPENPENWPQTTVDIMQESGGQALVDKLKESYQLREQQRAEALAAGEPDPAPAEAQGMIMWKTIMRKLVIQGLDKTTVVKTAADGLNPEVCMEVNGVEVPTEEMYGRVVALCSDEDFRRTRQWVAKITSVRQVLERQGAYLTDEEFAAAYATHEEPYKNSPFPLQVLAMGFKKFPSMDSYKAYYRLLESYQRSIQAELTDETLQEHMPRANQMLGLATVNAEVILCAAKDMQSGKFQPDGWEIAAEKAAMVVTALVEADGEDWDVLLEEHSDYWDPPLPQNSQMPMQPNPQKKNKGRFGALNRNEMVQRVGESDYDMFLFGWSVTDHIFFDQEVGTVGGPFRGPEGYYISRVKSRSQPTRPTLSLSDPNQRDLILQDYMACRFNQYAREVVEEATLEGM